LLSFNPAVSASWTDELPPLCPKGLRFILAGFLSSFNTPVPFLSQTVKSLLLLGSAYKEKVLHSFYGLREFCFFKLGRKYNFVSIFVTRPIVKV
jgi:hypothetical protein